MAVWSIVRFKVLSNYKIDVSFADGTTGVADLAPRLSQGPLGDGFDALCDEAVFAKASLEHGARTKTVRNASEYFASRSRIKCRLPRRKPASASVTLRAICVIHELSG